MRPIGMVVDVARIILTGLLAVSAGCAARETDRPPAKSIAEHFTMRRISRMIVTHVPQGKDDRHVTTAVVEDQKTLETVLTLLRKISAQGTVFMKFPKDIERWKILLQEGETTVGNLEFVGICLRAPDITHGTFCSGPTDDQERLLKTIVQAFSSLNK